MYRSFAVIAAPLFIVAACTQTDGTGVDAAIRGADTAALPGEATEAHVPTSPVKGAPFVFAPEARAERSKADAPIRLTASDGSGLELVAVEARALLEPPLAFTELTLTFDNPEARIREGRFALTLPEGASISRFAMEIGGRWQEGEVVEKQRARRVYEDFLHRRQDPALLEAAAGNQFSARVFPIPAGGRKRLIVSWSQELDSADTPYRLPLLGLPQVGSFEAKVSVQKISATGGASNLGGMRVAHETVEVSKKNWTPDQDLEIPQPKLQSSGVRQNNLVLLRVKPEVSAEPDSVHGLVLLVDSSASRALGFSRQLNLSRQLLRALSSGAGADTPVLIGAYDQTTRWVFQGPAQDAEAAIKKIHERRALGASDLGGALQALAAKLEESKTRYDRLVMVTDGVVTAGSTEGDVLNSRMAALANHGVQRADAIVVGGLTDEPQLRALTRNNLPRDGVMLSDTTPAVELARRLNQATVSGLKVQIPGAKWVWPGTLDGVQPGDERLVYADVAAGADISVSLSGKPLLTRAETGSVDAVLLERAWVKARMSRLTEQMNTVAAGDKDLKSALRQQITKLSVDHRVLSDYTALLVLETEHDYARYGIARKGLADILTVGDGGLKRLARSEPVVAKKPPVIRRTRNRGKRDDSNKRSASRGGPLDGLRDAVGDLGRAVTGRGDEAPPAASPAEVMEEDSDGFGSADDTVMAEGSPEFKGEAEASAAPSVGLELQGSGSGGGGEGRGRMVPLPRSRRGAASPARPSREEPASDEEVPGLAQRRRLSPPPPPPEPVRAKEKSDAAWTGRFAKVMKLLQQKKLKAGLQEATSWREEEPGNVLALIALGEAFEAVSDLDQAARAYGSIIDLFPGRADLRRHAAARLERLKTEEALALAVDCYQKSVSDRPDHPSGHRGLAMALLAAKRPQEAFDALVVGLKQNYPSRFPGVQDILRDDLGIAAMAWKAADPKSAKTIDASLAKYGGVAATKSTLRFVLSWETDANDVDFHIHDAQRGHAYYQNKQLPSGGRLYADVTQGYGPECFTIEGKPQAAPYRLEAHYYRRGPMGYGMGRLQIVRHDGRGNVVFEERPFVVMNDGAFVPLGTVQ